MGDGEEFEEIVAEYYRRRGYKAELTLPSHDYGADIILFHYSKFPFHNDKKIVVQAKYLSNGNVPIDAVQEVAGAIKHYNADEGWVITNSSYTNSAIQLAKSNNIQLIDNFVDDKEPSYQNKIPYQTIAALVIGLFLIIAFLVIVLPILYSGGNTNFNSYYQKAGEFYDSGQYLEAIKQLDLALSINPNSSDSWYLKGQCFGQLNRFEEAINCYNKAIEINPKNANAWNNKGAQLTRLNRGDEACQATKKAYALDPTDAIIKSNYNLVKNWCKF